MKKAPIFLDKLRHLKFDLNSFCLLEEKFGDIEAALLALEKGKMKAIRIILQIGLAHEDPDLTEEDVGKLVNIDNLDMVGIALLKALGEGVEQGEELRNFH